MTTPQLEVIVRTPREVVVTTSARSLRVPTETGQVGIRPRMEPLVIAVEPGLVVVRENGETLFVGTAGGLLRCDGARVDLVTPLAVTGRDGQRLMDAISSALARPSAEFEARTTLSRLERSIFHELRRDDRATAAPGAGP